MNAMGITARTISRENQDTLGFRVFQIALITLVGLVTLLSASHSHANSKVKTGIPDLAKANHNLTCTPTLAHFCANIHIGCAGRSALETWTLRITTNDEQGVMSSVDKHPAEPARSGEIVRDAKHNSLILFLHPTKDYVRVLPTGRFNFRHYTKKGPLMTYGWCEVKQ